MRPEARIKWNENIIIKDNNINSDLRKTIKVTVSWLDPNGYDRCDRQLKGWDWDHRHRHRVLGAWARGIFVGQGMMSKVGSFGGGGAWRVPRVWLSNLVGSGIDEDRESGHLIGFSPAHSFVRFRSERNCSVDSAALNHAGVWCIARVSTTPSWCKNSGYLHLGTRILQQLSQQQ